jgi:hypothetical protein
MIATPVGHSFVTTYLVFTLTFSIGCSEEVEAKDLWDAYVEAVNNKDLEAVARAFYSTSSVAYPKFIKENTDEDGKTTYFDGIESLKTDSFKYTLQSDVTTNKKWEKYASAHVKITLVTPDGPEAKEFDVYFLSGEMNVWNFTAPVNITSYEEDELGNKPNDTWIQRTIRITKDEKFKYKYVYDKVNGDYITIVQYIGNDKNVEIPAELDGAPVKVIKSYAFYKYIRFLNISIATSKVQKITIPYTVETIEDYAFYQCKKLQSVNIPNSVKTIGGNTGLSFASCRGLKTITINVDDSEMYGDGQEMIASTSTDGIEIINARNMYVGDIVRLTEASGKLVYWTVNNPDVVTVDRDKGTVTAIKNGSATITASLAADPTKKATVKITIAACPVLLVASSNSFDRCSGLEKLILNVVNPNCINTSVTKFRLSEDVKIYVPKGSAEMYKNNAVWSVYDEQIYELD